MVHSDSIRKSVKYGDNLLLLNVWAPTSFTRDFSCCILYYTLNLVYNKNNGTRESGSIVYLLK